MEESHKVDRSIVVGFMKDPDKFFDLLPEIRARHLRDPVMDVIFQAMASTWERGQPPTAPNIWKRVDPDGKRALTELGGIMYIHDLPNSKGDDLLPVEDAIHMVNRYALRNALENASADIGDLADSDPDPESIMVELEKIVSKVTTVAGGERADKAMVEVGKGITEVIMSGGSPQSNFSLTQIPDLDKTILGIEGGRVYTLGMPSHHGKTTVSMNIGLGVCMENPLNAVLFMSGEQGPEELTRMALAMLTGEKVPWILDGTPEPKDRISLSARRIRMLEMDKPTRERLGKMAHMGDSAIRDITEKERLELRNALAWSERMRFHIGASKLTDQAVRAGAMRLTRRYSDAPVALIIVDYVQLVSSPFTSRWDSDTQRIDAVCKGAKEMAQTLGVSILLNAQINRQGVHAWSDAPMSKPPGVTIGPGHFRSSDSPFHDADVVIVGVQKNRHPNYNGDKSTYRIDLSVIKNRQTGMLSNIALVQDPHTLQIERK